MGALSRWLRRRDENYIDHKGGKVYKTVNTLSMIGIFVAVALIVMAITGVMKLSSTLTGIIVAIAILCMYCMMALPWVRRIEKNEWKKTSIVFLGLIIVNCILWLVADILVISVYKQLTAEISASAVSEDVLLKTLRTLNYFKVSVIITLQASFAMFVANYITKYQGRMIPFQVIAYVSYLVVDAWLTLFLLSIKINSNPIAVENVLGLNLELLEFLISKITITIFILAVLYVSISKGIVNRMDAGRQRAIAEDVLDAAEKIDNKNPEEKTLTPEGKLAKFKAMFEADLISKEEYEQKRAEILKDM